MNEVLIRAWHGKQPGGHKSSEPASRPYVIGNSGRLEPWHPDDPRPPLPVLTSAAWWCDCGEPVHGGYAARSPLSHVVAAFRLAHSEES